MNQYQQAQRHSYRESGNSSMRHSQAGTTKAARLFGCMPMHRIETGLLQVMDWHEKSLWPAR